MATTNIYLNFDGNCEDAFNFYKSVFGGEFDYISRFKDMPKTEDYNIPESDNDKIMHVSLPIGSSTLMGSDVGSDQQPQFLQGNNFSVSFNANSKQEADDIFNGLAMDGTILMPMENTFWGDYFGMCTDKFGFNWMMSFRENATE